MLELWENCSASNKNDFVLFNFFSFLTQYPNLLQWPGFSLKFAWMIFKRCFLLWKLEYLIKDNFLKAIYSSIASHLWYQFHEKFMLLFHIITFSILDIVTLSNGLFERFRLAIERKDIGCQSSARQIKNIDCGAGLSYKMVFQSATNH